MVRGITVLVRRCVRRVVVRGSKVVEVVEVVRGVVVEGGKYYEISTYSKVIEVGLRWEAKNESLARSRLEPMER